MKTIRLAKSGKNALTSTNPNDFIFATDWSTPQIVAEGSSNSTLGVTASELFVDVPHGLNYAPHSFGFVKFANSRVGLIGSKASDGSFFSTNLRVNTTNERFGYVNNTGGNYSVTFKFLATEIPLTGTPYIDNVPGNKIVVAKDGFDATTERNPNNKKYDSQFGSLKYFQQDQTSITRPGSTPSAGVASVYETVLYTHNLGYYPFFTANLEFTVDDPGRAHIMPIMFADAFFFNYQMVYATTTEIIYRSEYGNSIGGIPYADQSVKVYWKTYSKNLGL